MHKEKSKPSENALLRYDAGNPFCSTEACSYQLSHWEGRGSEWYREQLLQRGNLQGKGAV